MILRERPGLWQLLFAVRGSVLPLIAPQLVGLMLYSVVLILIDRHAVPLELSNAAPFATFGIALSLFLGFRNNAAYDRWWEARKLWGGLLADIRALAREAEIFVPDQTMRREILSHALGFVHLHRLNLRQIAPDDAARAALPDSDLTTAAHPPCAALDRLGALIASGTTTGSIDGFGARALSSRIGSLALQQAGCERIATTPLPYVYSLLIYRTSYLYCLLVPLALIGPVGWLTPIFVGIIAYVFLGLAEVTEDLAHPFGPTPNGLPLDAICRAAEISLAPHLGRPVPAPLKPTGYFLG